VKYSCYSDVDFVNYVVGVMLSGDCDDGADVVVAAVVAAVVVVVVVVGDDCEMIVYFDLN
jgi:hypothetical protein